MFALLLNTLSASNLIESDNEHSTTTESETQETSKPVLNLTGYKKINFTVDLNKTNDELVSEMIRLVKTECPIYKKYYDMEYVSEKMQSNLTIFSRSNEELKEEFISDETDSHRSFDPKISTELTNLIEENLQLGNSILLQARNEVVYRYIEYANCYSIMRGFFLDELVTYSTYFKNRDLFYAIKKSEVKNKENIPVLQYFSVIGKRFNNAKFNKKVDNFKKDMRKFKGNQEIIDQMIETKMDDSTVV